MHLMKTMSTRPASTVFLLILFLCAGQVLRAGDEDLDRLFEEAFGGRPEPQITWVELVMLRRTVTEARALVTPTGTMHAVSANDLLALLEGQVDPAVDDRLRQLQDEDGWIRKEDLTAERVAIDFDGSRVRATVSLPAELRSVERIDLHATIPTRDFTIPQADVAPASVSGGVPIRMFLQTNMSQGSSPSWSVSTSIEPFVSTVWGTLQSGVTMAISPPGPVFTREPTFFRSYALDGQTLVTLGDVTPTGNRYQSRGAILGLSLERRRLQGGGAGNPFAAFSVSEPGTVEVRVNNDVVFRERLEAGRYEVGQAPVTRGINEVTISFPDSGSDPQTLWIPHESGLVEAEEHDFYHALGIRSESDYELSDLRLTSVHLYGFSEYITGGIGVQLSTAVQQTSGTVTAALPFGTIDAGTAVSVSEITGPGFALDLGYSLSQPSRTGTPGFRVSAGWTGNSFARADRPEGSTALPLSFSAGYARTVAGFTANARGTLRHAPERGDTSYALSLGVGSPSVESTRVSGRLEIADGSFSGSVLLRVTGPWQLQYRQNLHTPSARISAQTAGPTEALGRYSAGISSDLTVNDAVAIRRVDGRVGLAGGRGRLSAGVTTTLSEEAEGSLQLEAQSGILFADTAVAWSEIPGDAAFIIVQIPSGSSLEQVRARGDGRRLDVRPGLTGSRAFFFRQPFSTVNLTLRPEGLPLGYEIEQPGVRVSAGLRTGAVVRPQISGSVFVRGTLVQPDGEPLRLTAVQAFDDTRNEALALTFTNREGRFELGDLSAGTFRLESLDGEWTARFTVPEGIVGMHDSGTLPVEATP
ncbi:MAG: hypothetical protein EA383_05880 [Spirochaetaceae bacterium]|nr:MAG: hypothetical protein EA383_05880 [Spirochaetaceae bacterium]